MDVDDWTRIKWRIQELPPWVEQRALHDSLRDVFTLRHILDPEGPAHNDVAVHTLASDLRAINPKQTATVQFKHTPEKLKKLPRQRRLTIRVQLSASRSAQITIDKNFLGLTVLYSPKDYPTEQQINILAISGLGGHALGSFVNKNDGHTWLVDSLPDDLPFARVILYGYESTVGGSSNFATIKDFANGLYFPLRELLQMNQSSIPLIIIAHSLGGLLIKDVLIRLGESPSDSDLLQNVLGVLFFGVPHNGMDIVSLKAVVGDQPNRLLLESPKQNQLPHIGNAKAQFLRNPRQIRLQRLLLLRD